MIQIQGIFFFDVSVMIFMFVLAYLSGRLGDALKIPPLYKTLYVTTVMIILASVLDVLSGIIGIPSMMRISLIIRCVAGIVACGVVLRYWIWVFSEFFKH
jgi:hypothetical protein